MLIVRTSIKWYRLQTQDTYGRYEIHRKYKAEDLFDFKTKKHMR